MVIWTDVAVPIIHKCWHIHKIGGKLHRNFTRDIGDVPVARFNEGTGKWEPVVNNRGKAYGARNRLMFRRRKVDLINK